MDSHNRNAKRQELSGELNTDHPERDRISYLPNAVLCMILSFLPTKFSLATSVLSKRWNNVATSTLSNLDFDADLMVHNHQGDMGVYAHKMKCFEEFVNHVLSLTDGKNLERFRISWFQEAAMSCMYSWVAAVVVYNLREIDLSSSFCHSIHLPSRLFGCKTLVLLKLRGGFIIDLPTHVTLPNLTTLLLDSVTYLGDISLEKLISSCIVLEELHIVRQNWDGVQVVNIFAPSLKRLSLWFSLFHDQDNNIHGYKTCITAPNLEYLELNDHITLDYAIDSMPLLVEARVDAHLRQMCGRIGYAKTISLHGCSILSLKKSSNMCLFYSVTHLELGITEIDAWDWLIRLLGGTPFLQVLVFPEGLVKHDSKPYYLRRRKGTSTTSMIKWNPPQNMPGLPSSLEEVVIREFKGVENEMDLVMYLLDQARALKQITIYFDLDEEDDSNSRMEMVTEEILQYPRRSAACQINFIG